LYGELKKKYKDYPDDLIDFKIRIILRMNTEPNKITTSYDIISNEFKQDIIKRAEQIIAELPREEIEKLLLENEKFSVEKVGYINGFIDSDKFYKLYSQVDAETIYINNQLKFILDTLEISNMDQQTFFDELKIVRNTEIEETNDLDIYLRPIYAQYSKLFTTKINEMINKLASGNKDIKQILSNLGSITNYHSEMTKTLYETLKIEGFLDEITTYKEASFRLNIYTNVKDNIQLQNLIGLCEAELSYAHLLNTLNKNIDLNYESYQKILNNIVSFGHIFTENNLLKRISVINPLCISLILQYICLIILDKLKDNAEPNMYNMIIKQIVTTYVYSNRSNKTSYDVLTNIRNTENEKRKNRLTKLRPDEKALYKASRAVGTGKIIGSDLGEIMTEQEALINDMINSEVDRNARRDQADDLDEGYAYHQDNENEHDDL
jgi:hypothetical protein